jgi:hypothetical protein
MIVAHEIHEQIEHAGHGGHEKGGGILGPLIGITIAILGVQLALCSAQLGAARTELLASMNEANDASQKHQTVSTKKLMLIANTQQLVALQPNKDVFNDAEKGLKDLDSEAKNPDTIILIKSNRLNTTKVLTTVTPTNVVMKEFAKNVRDTQKVEKAAETWAESYENAIKVHSDAANRFETALVCTEIGIVVASVGLLLAKRVWLARSLWATSLVLGAISITVAGWTYSEEIKNLHAAEAHIKETKAAYTKIIEDKMFDVDEKMLRDIEDSND